MRKTTNTSFLLILLGLFFQLLVILIFLSSHYIQSMTIQEASWIENQLGTESVIRIQETADRIYTKVALDTHLEAHLKEFYLPSDEEKMNSQGLEMLGTTEGLWDWVEERIETTLDMIYWIAKRIALFGIWFPIFVPAFLIAGLNGFWERKIKMTNFQFSSPVLRNLSLKIVTLMSTLILVVFCVPVAIPPVIIPLLLVVLCFATSAMVSNIPKRF